MSDCWSALPDCGAAEYLFTVAPSMTTVTICAMCCAEWRAHPEDGECVRVTSLGGDRARRQQQTRIGPRLLT